MTTSLETRQKLLQTLDECVQMEKAALWNPITSIGRWIKGAPVKYSLLNGPAPKPLKLNRNAAQSADLIPSPVSNPAPRNGRPASQRPRGGKGKPVAQTPVPTPQPTATPNAGGMMRGKPEHMAQQLAQDAGVGMQKVTPAYVAPTAPVAARPSFLRRNRALMAAGAVGTVGYVGGNARGKVQGANQYGEQVRQRIQYMTPRDRLRMAGGALFAPTQLAQQFPSVDWLGRPM